MRPLATSSVISTGSIAKSPGKVPGSQPAIVYGGDVGIGGHGLSPEVSEGLVALADGLLEAGLRRAPLEGEALGRVAGDPVE